MNEYITYGIFIIYNVFLIGIYFHLLRQYTINKNKFRDYEISILSLQDVLKNDIREDLKNLKTCIRDYELNDVIETVKQLKQFYTDYELNEFGDKFKWVEDIVTKLDNVDAANKIEELEDVLDELDIRDLNNTISELVSEEYVNSEIQDLQSNINDNSDRIDQLEKIIGGFKTVLDEEL